MKIVAIIRHTGVTASAFDPSVYPPIEYIGKKGRLQDVYLVIDPEVEGLNNRIVYYNELLAREPGFGQYRTWESIHSHLTTDILEDYKMENIAVPHLMRQGSVMVPTPDTSRGSIGPLICSCEHDLLISTHYGDYDKKYMEDVYPARRIAYDFIVEVHEDHELNVNNTLPIVHGISCFPSVHENMIYAVDGGFFTRNNKDVARGDLLVDFTPCGGAEFIKLKDCKNYGEWKHIILPEGKTMRDKFVIAVINGRWYLPGEFSVLSDHVFGFDVNKYPAEVHYLDNLLTKWKYHYNTTQVIDTEFRKHATDIENDLNFLILVNNPGLRINHIDPVYQIADGMLRFPATVGGLLMDRANRSIINYTRIEYPNHTIVSFAHISKITQTIKDNSKADNLMTSSGYTFSAWKQFEGISHFTDPNYVMLDLVGSKQ